MSIVMNQAARFGAVGLLATAVHVIVAILLVEVTGLRVFWANIAAFAAAVIVSYAGNHRWTFACDGAHARYFPRFIAIAGPPGCAWRARAGRACPPRTRP